MGATDERLAALGELMSAGQSPREALASMERVGGGAGAWARQISGTAHAGGLGAALAQHRAIDRAELARIGGAKSAGTATALAWVVHRRRTLRARGRALWAVMALPALLTLATAAATGVFAAMLGAKSSLVLDLLPLAVVALGIAVATLRRFSAARALFASLPPFNALRQRDAEAELAAVVGAARTPLDGFTAAAELVPEHSDPVRISASLLREGARLEDALPNATAVGETLALRLAVGAAEGDLRPTLRAHAGETAARVTRRAAVLVRLVAYAVLLWVSVRSATTMMSVDLTSAGAGGKLNLDDALNIDPKQKRDLEELMRELDL